MRLHIESLAFGGDGVSHADDGRTVFVPYTCPGDTVDVAITKDHGRWLKAELVDIVEASKDRVDPPCPYFGTCGGCQWQHVAYPAQVAAKTRMVMDALQRIGGTDPESTVKDCIPSAATIGYRNKIELRPAPDSPGVLGFTHVNGRDVVAIDRCLLLPAKHAQAPRRISGALRYVTGDQDLGIERVGLRVASRRPDLEIALWTAPGPMPRGLAAKTLTDSVKASSVVRLLTTGPSKARRVSKVEVLSGKGFWRERLSGNTLALSAPSFFQVNTAGAETLVRIALTELDLSAEHRVLDCYAGAGTFTLPLAEQVEDVTAIESAGSSIRDLRRNLESSELWAEVIGGDAAREIPELGTFDRILIDPPRSGLSDEMIPALVGAAASRIVYVSCDPSTLARDARRLQDNGYRLASATPVDLFPQTFHVETVATFERL